jgi:ABC-type methionine transport system ATPase subunit
MPVTTRSKKSTRPNNNNTTRSKKSTRPNNNNTTRSINSSRPNNNTERIRLNALATQIQNHMNKILTGKMPTISQENFGRFISELETKSGKTFTEYKRNMNKRRK